MTGQAHWLPVLFTLAALGAIVLMAMGSVWLTARYRWRVRQVRCPATGRLTEVAVKQAPATGAYVDVERCARFADPDRVTCEKRCLLALNHR